MTSNQSKRAEVGLLSVFTMVLWIVCLIVGAVGLLTPPAHSLAPTTEPAALPPLEVLNVEMSPEPVTQLPPPEAAQPQAVPSLAAAPALPAVALPSPAIAFAQPVEGPVHIVSAAQANSAMITPADSSDVPWLTSDQGLDTLPLLEYPEEAKPAHLEGTVVVRFDVGTDGTVSNVKILTPSPWPILNQAAVRDIQEKWQGHFPTGPPRSFKYKLVYQL